MGVAVSSSHVVSVAPSSSGGRLLTLFPCSSVGSLPQEIVLYELLQCESFPWAAVLHKLPKCGSLPQGAALQEQAAPAWVPHRVTGPASKPAPAWAPLSMGPQVLAGACSSAGSPRGHSLLWASTCSSVRFVPWAAGRELLHLGPPWAAGGQSVSPWSSPWASGESLPCAWSTSSPFFCTDLGVCGVVSLTLSHFPLLAAVAQQLFPLLKSVIPEVLPLTLLGSALASGGSILEPVALSLPDIGEASGSFLEKPPL